MKIALTLPDEQVLELDGPIAVEDAIGAISDGLRRRAVAADPRSAMEGMLQLDRLGEHGIRAAVGLVQLTQQFARLRQPLGLLRQGEE